MLAMLGYCITLIYYRSNKIVKYMVSVTPVLIMFVFMPTLDRLTNGLMTSSIIKFLATVLGFGEAINPYIAMLSFIVGFGILSFSSFLLMRRAVIKQ